MHGERETGGGTWEKKGWEVYGRGIPKVAWSEINRKNIPSILQSKKRKEVGANKNRVQTGI